MATILRWRFLNCKKSGIFTIDFLAHEKQSYATGRAKLLPHHTMRQGYIEAPYWRQLMELPGAANAPTWGEGEMLKLN
jgi:hypothetical protein